MLLRKKKTKQKELKEQSISQLSSLNLGNQLVTWHSSGSVNHVTQLTMHCPTACIWPCWQTTDQRLVEGHALLVHLCSDLVHTVNVVPPSGSQKFVQHGSRDQLGLVAHQVPLGNSRRTGQRLEFIGHRLEVRQVPLGSRSTGQRLRFESP